MLSAAPWNTGPSGYIATSFAPPKENGNGGPGTLEITRLCTGANRSARFSAEYSRAAKENVVGAANFAQSCSIPAPIALCSSFAPLLTSWIRRSRSTGSSISVANEVNIADTLFEPVTSFSSSQRTDTGTTAINDFDGRPI